MAPDVVHHDPYDPHAVAGLEGLKASIRLNRTAFPDLTITVEDQLAEADKVATRWTATMTHDGELMDVRPTSSGPALLLFKDMGGETVSGERG